MGSRSSNASATRVERGGDTQFSYSTIEGPVVSGINRSTVTIESLDDDVVNAAFEFAEEFGVEAIQETVDASRDFAENATTFADNTVSQVTKFSRDAISKIEESTRSDLENVTLQTTRYLAIGAAALIGLYIWRRSR